MLDVVRLLILRSIRSIRHLYSYIELQATHLSQMPHGLLDMLYLLVLLRNGRFVTGLLCYYDRRYLLLLPHVTQTPSEDDPNRST